MIKVLFVCLGNICRSPAAEGVMKKIIFDEGLNDKIFVDSAGTSGYHIGELPDSRMRKTASKMGINLESRSRQLEKKDLQSFNYIIAMDDSNLRNITNLDKNNKFSHKIFKLTDLIPNSDFDHVPDPYFGGEEGFVMVLELVERGCEELFKKIKNEFLN